jgi:ATP-dependent Lhr-like helicase
VLAATDPAQPYGAALPWPKREGEPVGSGDAARPAGTRPAAGGRRPSRTPGALVVLAGSEPVLYLERGGRALQSLVEPDDPRVGPALQALADHARAGRIRRIALEKVDGESVMGTPWEAALAEVGFRAGPRKLTLSA